jgi:apolipoprotein N-acyltransferase
MGGMVVGSDAARPPVTRLRWLTRLWPVGAAIVAGFVLVAAFPPIDQWWLAPFGVALFALATYRRGFWAGAGLGFLTGLSLMVPLLRWAGGYVGAVWLFLPFGESFYFALLGGLFAVVSPMLTRWRWAWPLATGTLWVLQEALRDRTPYGGFPWGRLAFSQGDSPLLGLAAVGGAPLVTFAVGAVGGLVALAVRVALDARAAAVAPVALETAVAEVTQGEPAVALTGLRQPYGWLRPASSALAIGIVATVVPFSFKPSVPTDAPTLRVAVVQGNVPRLGLDFNAQRRAVLENHVNATMDLAERVRTGQTQKPDLVVWPENSSDIDPLDNLDAAELISQAAAAVGAPILVGGLRDGPGPKDVRNVGWIWDPVTGKPTQSYIKRHPVPFAEYMPMRDFLRKYVTDKVDLVRRDFVAGDEPGVLTVGSAKLGDVICFEVAYDEVVRDTVTGGAQLLVVQTNNATFTEAEARQQLAMVRLRAVEHGREALMASTVGVSAFVDAKGNVYDATRFYEQAVIERSVYLGSGRTMATRLGVLPELVLVGGAVAIIVLGVVLRVRARRPVVAGRQA